MTPRATLEYRSTRGFGRRRSFSFFPFFFACPSLLRFSLTLALLFRFALSTPVLRILPFPLFLSSSISLSDFHSRDGGVVLEDDVSGSDEVAWSVVVWKKILTRVPILFFFSFFLLIKVTSGC